MRAVDLTGRVVGRLTIPEPAAPSDRYGPGNPNPEPGRYFVTVFDRASNAGHGRYGFLLGPFRRHHHALAWVDRAREKACEVDDRAHWYAYGTSRLRDVPPGEEDLLAGLVGVLNELLPEAAIDMTAEDVD